jgi:uncharacterized membrane protein SirB2
MTGYTLLKAVHVSCVALSGAGFALRGALALAGSPLLQRRWVRVLPHVVDTLLLASAVAMAWIARLSPAAHPWLAAKIALLVLYVLLGSIALRHARTPRSRALAYSAALATFALIVGIALTRSATLGLIQ